MDPDRLGASSRFIEIDLTSESTSDFTTAFAAKYTAAPPQAISRRIVAVAGTGSLTVKDAAGGEGTLTLAAGQAEDLQLTSITARTGITRVRVLL